MKTFICILGKVSIMGSLNYWKVSHIYHIYLMKSLVVYILMRVFAIYIRFRIYL
jgi:hypothetical protein